MPYAMWTFWFLAGGVATVSLVLLAPRSRGEWIAAGARRRATEARPRSATTLACGTEAKLF
jgi:hypothetical protein